MPTRRIPLPFHGPFTTAQARAAGYSPDALRGWLQRGEVRAIGRGCYAPASTEIATFDLRIHINRNITEGRHPLTFEAAALVHGIWLPPSLRPRHKVPQRIRDLPVEHLEQRDGLLVPSRALTVLELARWQTLAGAMVSMEWWAHQRFAEPQQTQLAELIARRERWPGMRPVWPARNLAQGLSDSPLEAYSLGLIVGHGLPLPVQQQAFVVDGYTYYVDFFWPTHGLIGEADGAWKYDPDGRAQHAERRRQARLQTLGLEVVRWGWPELLPNPTPWLATLARRLRTR